MKGKWKLMNIWDLEGLGLCIKVTMLHLKSESIGTYRGQTIAVKILENLGGSDSLKKEFDIMRSA